MSTDPDATTDQLKRGAICSTKAVVVSFPLLKDAAIPDGGQLISKQVSPCARPPALTSLALAPMPTQPVRVVVVGAGPSGKPP
eukprot:1399926-Pleurochrysis_carterae.AAC.1